MNNLKEFKNTEFGRIRIEEIGNNPWFLVKDICDALGLSNVTETIRRLDEDELSITEVIDSIGRRQQMRITNESGLYSLIM